jgi:hypothetical protein
VRSALALSPPAVASSGITAPPCSALTIILYQGQAVASHTQVDDPVSRPGILIST